jgi:cardiolipin synthase
MALTFADKVSSIRIILLPVFISLLMYSRVHPWAKDVAIVVFVLAVLSDFFDGLVARIKKEKSDLGQIIDPLADKLLMLSSFIALYMLRNSLPLKYQMPLEIVLVVVSRDVILSLGLLVFHLLNKKISIEPSIWGKLTTFSQMFTVFCLLVNFVIFPIVWKLALIFTVISGVDYFSRGIRSSNGSVKPSHI